MVSCGIYLIVRHHFIVNRLSCCIINQQQLQWAVYMVLRVASTYYRSYYSIWLLTTLAHTKSILHTTFYFILFVSSGLGMCDRLNSLVCAVIQGSLICAIKLTCKLSDFFNLMRLMHERRTASIKFWYYALWPDKYGKWKLPRNYCSYFVGHC